LEQDTKNTRFANTTSIVVVLETFLEKLRAIAKPTSSNKKSFI